MTVRDADVEDPVEDPDDGWFGQAIVMEDEPREHEETDESSPDTAPIPVIVDQHDVAAPEADDSELDTHDFDTQALVIDDDAADTDTDTWYVPAADPTSAEFVPAPPEEPAEPEEPAVHPVEPAAEFLPAPEGNPPPVPWETPVPNDGAWDFTGATTATSRRGPRYAVVAAACVAAAGALVGVVLLVRSPGPAVDGSTTAAPSESAQPAPLGTAPALSAQAPIPAPTLPPDLPPGPPPPPPPTAAEEISPGSVNRQYSPSYQTPDAPQKPQMDVTRAPMSATPPPPPKPDRNSSTPGDSPKRRGFFR